MTYDSATWLAFALVLTAAGGGLTWVAWHRRGAASAIRGLAWTMLPLAAWLTGTLRLAVEVASDVGNWATRLVFSPSVWLGIILAGMAVVLFGVGGALKARGIGSRKAGGTALPSGADPRAVPAVGTKAPKKSRAKGEEDMDDDIAAILRKHGIS